MSARVLLDGSGWCRPISARDVDESLCVIDGRVWRFDGAWHPTPEDPWEALRSFSEEGRTPIYGLVSYDAGRLIENVPSRAMDDTRLPQMLFHRFRNFATMGPMLAPPMGPMGAIEARSSPKQFEEMVTRAKRAIREGEIFQANLSHRLETTTSVSPDALYSRLRDANPAPFACLFESGPLPGGLEEFHVLSSSPERLFKLEGGKLEARPIAGTRRRGANAEEDAHLQAELGIDEKERAEHVMLVDLARNDLGRVARFGSVRVPHLLDVESYRTVHHLVSRVEADLAEGKDAVDALVAMFPGGTITGAPKARAMEVIEEIEPVRRGVYTGSVGWISPDGDCDFNILIRTLLLRGDRVHLQVGAGIVEDSVPHKEYEETLAKAKGLLLALGKESL